MSCKRGRANLSWGGTQEATVKIAVYPGSFDPITNGHLDVVQRAATMFDRVIIGVARNAEKTALFSESERVALARTAVGNLANV